jgi:hypothetical protein
VDTGPEQRLIGVDIPKTADQFLVEDDRLDLGGATAQTLFEPCRRESALEWLATKSSVKTDQIIAMEMNDAAELALIGEAEIETVVELDRQPLETKRWLLVRYRAQPAGHTQVDHDRGAIVEIDNEVLGASSDTEYDAPFDTGENVFDAVVGKHPGEIANVQGTDALTDDLVDQRAADGLDLWEFWHTRTVVLRSRRGG